MKEVKTGVYFYNEESYNFNFCTGLSAYDKMVFVNSVVDTLIDDNNYNSIVKDLIFDFTIVRLFTDINTSFINQKDDDGNIVNPIIIIEQFLENSNIVDVVKANVSSMVFDELSDAIDKSIQYRTGIHSSPISDAIASLISTFEKKINEVNLDELADMAQKISGIIGEFTPDSIVNAYMNSDVHKNNLAEIEEAKNK